jgi:hypothetical protein
MTLLEVAAELYGLPLAEFTPARDARAKALKGTPEAAGVKSLRKPSTAAWVVNILVRFETDQVAQLLEVGAGLRAAQESLDAAQLRELTVQRRQLTAAMTTRARALARERGLRVTDAVAEQVEQTLTAAMVDEGAAAAVSSGLLVAPMQATGFTPVDAAAAVALPDALGHVAAPASRELHAVAARDARDPAKAARAEAEKAVAAAQVELKAAVSRRDQAARLLSTRQAHALQVQSELDELRRRMARLEEAAQAADDELAEAEEAHDQAEADVVQAQAELAAAEKALD